MFGHNVFTHPFEAQIGGTKRSTFLAEGSPMVSVKIDTTATNVSPDWEVTHQEEEKGTNWFLWGGIAAVVAVVFIV